jgi:hypothetical protein
VFIRYIAILLFAVTVAHAQPGGQRAFFQAWWGVVARPLQDLIDLGDVELYFDASTESTVFTNASGIVTQWVDRAVGGRVATVGYGEFDYITTNGNKGIKITFADSYFDLSSSFAFSNIPNTTFIAIGELEGTTTSDRMVFLGGSNFRPIMQVIPDQARFDPVLNEYFTRTQDGELSDIDFLQANLYVATTTTNSTTSTNDIKAYVNGTERALQFGGLQTADDIIYIGRAAANRYDSGIFYEVAIIGRILTDEELNEVYEYANNKYGID